MTNEVQRHDIQMKILRELLFTTAAGFAELQKSTDLTSDHFSFHIKKLVDDGLVAKQGDAYVLTQSGKE